MKILTTVYMLLGIKVGETYEILTYEGYKVATIYFGMSGLYSSTYIEDECLAERIMYGLIRGILQVGKKVEG